MNDVRLAVIEKYRDIYSEFQKKNQRIQPRCVDGADALLLSIKMESRAAVAHRMAMETHLFDSLGMIDLEEFFMHLSRWVICDE